MGTYIFVAMSKLSHAPIVLNAPTATKVYCIEIERFSSKHAWYHKNSIAVAKRRRFEQI